ncbi:MAG: molybdopterin-dependent oxidoreductase, partial [Pseudomonadota bacterium]|nr:molybdopterin-dependent oxidoreductase [Pseudomonadota bacterium]
TVSITPDYAEVSKLTDEWLSAKQGTDAALAMAMGHVILKEFHLDSPSAYFTDYVKRYTDMPFLVALEPREDGSYAPGKQLRAADYDASLGQDNNPEWKTVAWDEKRDQLVVPRGSIGFRWGENGGEEKGKWSLESLDADGQEVDLRLSLADAHDSVAKVAFPYFGGIAHEHFDHVEGNEVLHHCLPAKKLALADGKEVLAVTVFDLMCANYGIDRGLGGDGEDDGATSLDQLRPYTPAWQQKITGVPASQCIRIAREFASNADKTQGRSMIIVGAGMNHWYHMDMNYRGLINMLVLCGCIGQSGGGWSHYVGQEKLRPQTGWLPLAFGLDWQRPPRQMNGTSFFYNHSSQWRYEKLEVKELLSPLADPSKYDGSLIDFNVRAERMGWLPSAPQLGINPLRLAGPALEAGMSTAAYTVNELKAG